MLIVQSQSTSESSLCACELILFCLQPNPSLAVTPQQSSMNQHKIDPVSVSLWFAVIVTALLCILFLPAAICSAAGIGLAVAVNPPYMALL